MNAKKTAACAVEAALLVAVQFALGFVPGVELVTLLFLAFCRAFGAKCGMLTATAFSLLRCAVFGLTPNVLILYLIYYNAFAALFGSGVFTKIHAAAPVLLAALSLSFGLVAALGLPVSVVYAGRLRIISAVLCALFAALFALYLILKGKNSRATSGKAAIAAKNAADSSGTAALAATSTVLFTLLDDALTPLLLDFTREGALAYFYAGFLTMIPQVLCVALSVFLLYPPLFAAMKRISAATENRPIL